MSYDQERAHNLKSRPSTQDAASTKQAHPSVGMLLHMQRTAGNAAVNALLSGRSGRGTAVQRAAAVEEGEADTQIGERIRSASGKGSPLGGDVQRTLESGLGASMSGVNVHTDSEADHLAKSVDSVAFTTGSDIFFRSGAYNPGTSEGMHLLAHEATHTVQQAAGPVSGTPSAGGVSISDPSDSYEQAAEASASRVMSGAGAPAQRMAEGAAGFAVQREDEGATGAVQTMRSSEYQAVQRESEGGEEEEEAVQGMRSSQFEAVQRESEGGEEEEEAVQGMRSSQFEAVQREAEGAEEEEEQVQGMRSSQFEAVQREAEGAEEEEEAVQGMRAAQFAAVQRHGAEEEA
jgi:hypothetical protein